MSNFLQFTQSAHPANTKSVKLHWLTYYITVKFDCDFHGSCPLAEVWTICYMQKHFFCGDANHWCSVAFLLSVSSNTSPSLFSTEMFILACWMNIHTSKVFTRIGDISRRSGAPFMLSVHQASPLPAGQYSGVERGEWCISNDREREFKLWSLRQWCQSFTPH